MLHLNFKTDNNFYLNDIQDKTSAETNNLMDLLTDFILGKNIISKLDLIHFMSSLKSNPLWAALSAYSGPYKTMK